MILLLLLEIYNAITLRKKAVAAEAVKLLPGAAAGMAVGPQIDQPESAAIVTSDVGAKVLRGVHRTGTAVCGRHGLDKGGLLRFTFLTCALIKKYSLQPLLVISYDSQNSIAA